jgi:hypothetical protein
MRGADRQQLEKEDSSFLKKRSKKLLQMASGVAPNAESRMLPVISKSFLVLFFKKELLSSFRLHRHACYPRRRATRDARWR